MRLLGQYFSYQEMTFSRHAAKHGIKNEPGPAELANLKRLCIVLDEVRRYLGKPMLVSSGYRSPEVNAAVGGVPTSQHVEGLAADFICPGFGTPARVCEAILQADIQFDQLILEYNRWVHLSVPRLSHPARLEVLTIHYGRGYVEGIVPA